MNSLRQNYEASLIRIEEEIGSLFEEMEKRGMDTYVPSEYMMQIETGFIICYGPPHLVRTRKTEYFRELRGRQLHHLLIYFSKCRNGE